MSDKLQSTVVNVNNFEWSSNNRRRDIACISCENPTRGRLNKKPYCLDCAMKLVMSGIKGLFAGLAKP